MNSNSLTKILTPEVKDFFFVFCYNHNVYNSLRPIINAKPTLDE